MNVRPRRRILAVLLFLVGSVVFTASCGAHLLVAPDPLPQHADVAVVMGGSYAASLARFDGAVRLMQEGRVDHIGFRVDPLVAWGRWQPEVVRRYIKREYGDQIASKVILCEVFADSTREGAKLINHCLQDRGFRSMIVVTSNYHTRRTKLTWRAELARRSPGVTLAVHGVLDGDFEARGWWRHRQHAETWLLETTKLAWLMIESLAPSFP